jgi:acyl-ACP thioesterase
VIGDPLQRRPEGEELREQRIVYRARRTVRADATRPDHRLQFDGVARYLQDLGQDHLEAAEFEHIHPYWIARRTVIDMYDSGHWPEKLTLERWASKMGSRWCTVRIDLDGDAGTRVESDTFWINFNIDTGTPSRLDDEFVAKFGQVADPGVLRWKAWLDPKPHPDAEVIPFRLRSTDLDYIDHVNNAVYWAALEEALHRHPDLRDRTPLRGIVEHNSPLVLADEPTVLAHRDGDTLSVWLMAGERNAAALAAQAL